MLLGKSRDFWFALIPVVGPDAAEVFLVNCAVFCRLQLSFNLSQQLSHRVPLQSFRWLHISPKNAEETVVSSTLKKELPARSNQSKIGRASCREKREIKDV